MDSDLGQPRRELGRACKLAEVRVGANIRFLHDVFGFLWISQHDSRDTIQPLIVAAHQSIIQSGFACANPLDEFIVVQIVQSGTSSNIHKDRERNSQKVTKFGSSAM